jgi:hypothetical protein
MLITRRSNGSLGRGLLLPLLALLFAQAGCMSTKAPERTGTMEAFGVDMTSRRARLSAQNLANLYMSTVELTADSIIRVSRDPAIQYAALSWKANAIPAFQRAMFQSDPLVSWVDGWTLIVQMRQFYDVGGAGEDRFGPHQAIAVEGIRAVETQIDSAVMANQPTEVYERFHNFVYNWADSHHLNDLYLRRSVGEAALTQLSDDRPQGMAQLGTLTEFASDAQHMSLMLATYIPKEVRWQSELLIGSLADTTRLSPVLAAVDSMAVLQALTDLLEQTPGLIAEERAALFREVSRERLAILENLERQRIATLQAAVDLINSERESTVREVSALIASERGAITDAIADSKAAIMDGSRGVIDHIVWRVIQVGAIFLLIAGAFTLFVLRRLQKI